MSDMADACNAPHPCEAKVFCKKPKGHRRHHHATYGIEMPDGRLHHQLWRTYGWPKESVHV